MSIWATHAEIGKPGTDPMSDDFDGTVRTFADGWSNHYPTDDVEKPASVGLAFMPAHCVPGYLDDAYDGDEDGAPGPWLRMHLLTESIRRNDDGPVIPDGATVILKPSAARTLGAALIAWADGGHTSPREAA